MRLSRRRLAHLLKWYLRYNIELARLHEAVLQRIPDNTPAPDLLAGLDSRRISAQEELGNVLSGYRETCAACQGRCCLEDIERYTVFDWLLWQGAGRDLPSYGKEILSLNWMISNAVTHAFQKTSGGGPPGGDGAVSCRHLGPAGCTIDYELRPMLCTSWMCPRLILAMDDESLTRVEEPLEAIRDIHRSLAASVADGSGSGS